MAHDFLIFEFGNDEDTAQQARRKVEAWVQGGRLGKKIILKYEREDAQSEESANGDDAKLAASKKKSSKAAEAANGNVRVLIRLDFSGHEKLSHQRWLDRIPTEEPFKSKKAKIVRHSDPHFAETSELFDALT
ncbi:MAG TPA: hypothetical protein VGD60_04805 [Candidatus Acidoferrales bacterium]